VPAEAVPAFARLRPERHDQQKRSEPSEAYCGLVRRHGDDRIANASPLRLFVKGFRLCQIARKILCKIIRKVTLSQQFRPLLPPNTNALTVRHAHVVPSILANAGENAATKFLEFFGARIRNANTREAYARACGQFLSWSEQRVDDLRLITPMHVAAYIEQHPGSPQTIKQHLAAIKMLFDYLVISQVVPINPAAPVKGPTYVVKRGKTPVLSVEDTR
jgi:hypothetical protein